MADPKSPSAFVSYSHDSDEHKDRVLALADALRHGGINVMVDLYVHPAPDEGWFLWMENHLDEADFVLMICTEAYLRRVMGKEQPGKGLGVRWEGKLIYSRIYNDKPSGSRFIPILLSGSDRRFIPGPVQGHNHYNITTFDLTDQGYEGLYRHLTGQPPTPQPDLGTITTLPPRPRRGSSPAPLTLEVVTANALDFHADVLALKYAQALYGVDHAAVERLSSAVADLQSQLPPTGQHLLVDTRGKIPTPSLLFIGVSPLYNFGYEEIRAFGRAVLESLAEAAPETRHLAMTIHGPGYGLDESEAFRSQLAGIFDAVNDGRYPKPLMRVSIIEQNSGRATRLASVLGDTIPGGKILLRHNHGNIEIPTEILRSLDDVGHGSKAKPSVFVAMPFASEYDDHFHYGIQGASNAAGLLCERADLSSFTGDVMEWVKERIASASLMIADLSSANPNVYLEVGYAWGKGVPTVLLVQDAEELKFDVRGQRCIVYRSIRHLEESLRRELQALHDTRPKRLASDVW